MVLNKIAELVEGYRWQSTFRKSLSASSGKDSFSTIAILYRVRRETLRLWNCIMCYLRIS